ncbi:MAG: lysophospholipid acyltransferase family protein [Salibacteraceae bacterium]
MRLAIPVYFRRVVVLGQENIPKDKPVILASNHPNTFLDPVLIGIYYPRELHFLVRADVFRSPVASFVLRALNQFPIYRMRDGYDQLARNRTTFDSCLKLLKKGKPLLFFPEADSENEWHLRPLRKGTARLALEATAGGLEDVQIIPVGLHYSSFDKFRGEASVSYGKPIAVADYLKTYQEHPAKAYRELTDQITQGIRAEMIDVPREEDQELVQACLQTVRASIPSTLPKAERNVEWLNRQRQVIQWLSKHPAESPERQAVKSDLYQLREDLKSHDIAFREIPPPSLNQDKVDSPAEFFLRMFILVFGLFALIVVLPGQLVFGYLAQLIAGDTIFAGAINLSLRALGHLIWSAFCFFLFGPWIGLAVLVAPWLAGSWESNSFLTGSTERWQRLKSRSKVKAEAITTTYHQLLATWQKP